MRSGYRDDQLTGDFEGERLFSSGADIRYVVHEAEASDLLLVAFSAVHEPDKPPRYYFHRALRAIPCHRLFVLDDHGPDEPLRRPSWYLGHNRSTDVPDAIERLVADTAEELGVDRRRVVTCGSSKGGWAALYFGARLGTGHVFAGEPQVLLGRHLMQEENLGIARHVAGDVTDVDRAYLDGLLFEAFRAAAAPPDVHLYCGSGSPYRDRDVLPLVRFLDELGIPVDLELGDHSEHVPDLGIHFPGYMTRRMEPLLQPA